LSDDDVEGHAFTPTRTAEVTMTWSKDENGEEKVNFHSDDPDAEKVLLAIINGTPQKSQAASAS